MMGVQDALTYVLFTNPISSGAGYYAKTAASAINCAAEINDLYYRRKDYLMIRILFMQAVNYAGIGGQKIEYKMVAPEPLWKLAANSGPYVRLAALSGASAVILGAFGSHKTYPEEKGVELKRVFETASRYHFFHALAMMTLPLCRRPFIAATFMISGTLMFCGSSYYYAFTGNHEFRRFTPIGGTCLIIGWLSMCL